jgi:hypothetical protein
MLFLELFPLFMLLLSLLVGVWLIVAHREAGRDDDDPETRDGPS